MSDTASLHPARPAAYFTLIEAGSLLQHAVDQQLREDGGLSYIQFQILAVLGETADRRQRMTDVADRLVHSRSGLTYQLEQLAEAGWVTKASSADDERSVVVCLTPVGQVLLSRVMAGHVQVLQRLLLAPLSSTRTSSRSATCWAVWSGTCGPSRPLCGSTPQAGVSEQLSAAVRR